MKLITTSQIKIIHTLLRNTDMIEYKADLVHTFSNGRVTSTKELTSIEASHLIDKLRNEDPLERMRKKVFYLARKADMIYGNTPEDHKMNAAKIDSFILERGTVKKSLNSQTKKELVKTVSQFEKILEHNQKSSFNKHVKSTLEELKITQL